jgi:hypothetical protein
MTASITAASPAARGIVGEKTRMVGCPDPHMRAAEMVGARRVVGETSRAVADPVRNAPLLEVKPQGWNCHAPVIGCRLSLCLVWNESRTNRARIADSGPVGIRSRQYVVALALLTTKSCKGPGNGCNKRSPSITGSAGAPKFAVRSSGDARRIIASSPSPCSVAASR